MTPPMCWRCFRRMYRVAYRRSTKTWIFACTGCGRREKRAVS